jgi:hypothetical protein
LEDFGSLLQPSLTIIPSHVKRDANKVADCLENEGVATMIEQIHWNAQTSPRSELSDRCQDLGWGDTIIEEEFPELLREILHMASQDALLPEGYDISSATARDRDPGKEEGAQGWSAMCNEGA